MPDDRVPIAAPGPDPRHTAPPAPSSLTESQLLFWFAHELNPEVQLYFDAATTTFSVDGEIDPVHFRLAFQKLVDNCDSLRSTFPTRNGAPYRHVTEGSAAPLELVDLGALPDPAAAWESWLGERCRVRLDLERRLFDSALVRLAPRRWVWFWNVHHIIADAWSIARIAQTLSRYYRLACAAQLDSAPPLPSYQRYVEHERRLQESPRYEQARRYWEEKLSSPLVRATFYGREAARHGQLTVRSTIELGDRESAAAVAAVRRAQLFSPAVVFATTLFSLLYRLTNERTLRIGTPFANRGEDWAETVGLQMKACPLQIQVDDGETFLSLARKVQRETVATARYEFFPVRNPAPDPVYEIYLNYQNIAFTEFCGLPVEFALIQTAASNDLFNLQVRDFSASGRFTLDFDLNADVFDATERERTVGHYLRLLAAFCDREDQALAAAAMLSAEEEHELVHALNQTAVDFAAALPIHELIASRAAGTPDATAVALGEQQLTYRELELRAGQLAHRLREMGVGPDVRVGIHMERSLDMVVGLLGILAAGGAYVPLDTAYPPQRLAFMLEDARVSVLLSQRSLVERLPAEHRMTVLLDEEWRTAGCRPSRPPRVELDDGNLAYVIYTSGSTGQPKGVMATHGGIRNRLLWMQQAYGLAAADRVLQKTPLSFDVSVWEVFWPLLAGATLCVAIPGGHQDPAYLARTIAGEDITVLHFVPSMLHAFLAQGDLPPCAALRWVVCSGEALSDSLRQRCFERLSARLENLYGPTEASVDVTSWTCTRAPCPASPPIGRPIANTRIHLLDRDGNLAPRGLPGELHIGGAGLARGYLGRPDLTAEKFIPDRWSVAGEAGARLYRTGDLARYLPSGDIEFLGRLDHQVKLRGFRIELGEIEAALCRHPAIDEAAVAVREDRPGDRRLVAYLVARGEAPPLPGLRSFLAQTLPEHMLPAAAVALAALPLTPSGKLDRRALPAPDAAAAAAGGGFVAPRGPIEGLLATIWAEVLGREEISVADSFFDLGGNSLLATQVSILVQEVLPVELPLRKMFESPTIAGIAALIEESAGSLSAEERQAMSEVLAEYSALAAGHEPATTAAAR